ncbi:nuclear transport factor 2 family protein [Paenibacillus sp. YPG26]|uniref:nuclear transport factor 2 family protein n=1 Tax=Paenibacillus sp. YPG26 TaxID=2878915 RepID=UPI00203D7D85|nr:nuclear transport factor 2 family protein [Paenibacillus sp. YPG26]USB31798.1 nuclear transport factor 2 family protein [Paenibacillus sp. YPG26]
MAGDVKRDIIEKYIEAYNTFDIEGMVGLLDKEILFRNISNGEVDTEIQGIEEFRELAGKSAAMFSNRCQTITGYAAEDDQAEVQIDYEGTLAVDLPNGLKAGDKIHLQGKSVFQIKEGKLTLIEDHS